MSEQSFVSLITSILWVLIIFYVDTLNVVCHMMRHFMIDYLYMLFVGDGGKHQP
jgi:hypothetical protein